MGNGSSASKSKPKQKGRRAAPDLSDYDDDYGGGRSPSHSYYDNRGKGVGRKGRNGKSPNLSPVTIRSSRSAGSLSRMPSRSGTAGSLGRRRREWAEETAKRIHVVVRVRPLNVREIKEGAKVANECFLVLHSRSELLNTLTAVMYT